MSQRSNAAIAAQEFREAISQEMHRMRSAALQMREAAAGGRKLIAETWDRIAVANALATPLLRRVELSNDLIRGTAFEREVSCCFGVMPSFFCSASAAPGLIEELWSFAKSAYIDSPLPSLFKERLFVHLSRFCEVRYCIIRHVGFLIGEGRPAGDPKVKPETIEEVRTLLRRRLPGANALRAAFARLESYEEVKNIPAPGTQVEYDLFDALTVMFLEPLRAERASEAVRRVVGDGRFEILVAFLAFVRTAHYWTEIHPELAIEPDMLTMLEKHAELARLLLDPSEAENVKAGEALRHTLTELQDTKASLRESKQQSRWHDAIVRSSDDAIISTDLDGIIRSWNKGAEPIFGYMAEEVIGKPTIILVPPERHHEEDLILGRIRCGERVDHYETIRRRKDGSLLDISLTISPVRDANGKIVGASKVARDITERKRSEAQISILAREAEHRAKNLLASVTAIVGLSQSDTPNGLKEAIQGRIGALASVHSLFAQSRWTGAEVGVVVKRELSPYSRDGGTRMKIDGPTVVLKPELAQAMALALHELATNAAKYGALSETKGQVRVEWSDTGGQLVLRWTEAGGPPVNPPMRKGFGTHMMEMMIRGQKGADVQLNWLPDGLVCEIILPT
jgi:PAS domain S-box-containing protein